jgi:serine/threonine-protein kinase HipA
VAQTEAFFGALLPEGNLLENLAREAKVSSSDLRGLLAAVGADLAGALRIGDGRPPEEPELLSPAQIGQLLRTASGFLVGGGGSALPGYQRKLTLTRRDGSWYRGNGTWPSTHILKPVSPDDRPVVDAELYTLHVGRQVGLVKFDSWVEVIDDRPTLVVERYDRIGTDPVERLHQEDFGQALGIPWGGNDKFEQVNSTSSLQNIAAILDSRGAVLNGMLDRQKLLQYVTFNVATGNTDAHAKNFSLLHQDDGRTRLAPMYDVAPLALDYANGTTMAMRVNGKLQLPDVTVDDLVAEGRSWGIPETVARRAVDVTLEAVVEATRLTDVPASIETHVPGYFRGQAQNLLEGRAARIRSAVPLMSLPRLGTPQPRD